MFDPFTIAISFAYTIILYGIGPFLFAKLRKRPIKTGSVKAFSIVYTGVIWLGSNALMVLCADGTVSSGLPAVLWGTIFYRMLKKALGNTSRLIDDNQTGSSSSKKEPVEVLSEHDCSSEASEQPDHIVSKPKIENPHTEAALTQIGPKDPPKRRFPVLTAVLVLACIFLATSSCIFWNQANSIRREVNALEKENAELQEADRILRETNQSIQSELNELSQEHALTSRQLSMFEDSIGFVVNGSNYYHTYKCNVYKHARTYRAHNIDYCIALGYSQCPECWGSERQGRLIDLKTGDPIVLYNGYS